MSDKTRTKNCLLPESRDRDRMDMGWRNVGCCSHCCQEGRGWPCLLLPDILPILLSGFAKGAETGSWLQHSYNCQRFCVTAHSYCQAPLTMRAKPGAAACRQLLLHESVLSWSCTGTLSALSMKGFYDTEVEFACLSLSFAADGNWLFLFIFAILQNDSWPLTAWAQAVDHDLQDLSSFPAPSHRFDV